MSRENRRALKKKLLNRRSRTLAANVLDNLDNEINNMIRDGDLNRVTGNQAKEGK